MRRILVAAACVLLAAGAVTAQSALTVGELQAAAKRGNLDLQKAMRAVVEAEKELGWESEISNAKASLSGGYSYAYLLASDGGQSGLSGQASVSVPIVPQLAVGASLNSSGVAGATLSVSPFAASRTSYAQTAAYRKAVTELEYASARLLYDVESAAYAVLRTQATLALAEESLPLKAELAEVARQVYELGELTYNDLEKARSDLIAARQSVFDAKRGLLNAQVALYRLLGPEAGQPGVVAVSQADLEARIAALDLQIAERKKSGTVASLALRRAEISLESLRAQLRATLVYRPSLGLSGQLSYDPTRAAGTTLTASASLSYSFSPSEIRSEDRADISRSIAETAREVELERLALELGASVADEALAVARQALESRRADLAQAQATLEQARLLLAQGERTTLEVEQARIAAESARTQLFAAAAAVIDAQAELLLAYVI